MFIFFVICLLLGLVFVQDLKYRAVSWTLFPVLGVVFLIFNLFKISIIEILNNAGINFIFLLIVMAFVVIYFSIKYRRFVNIFNKMIGWGDMLFFLCLSILLSPINFVLFFTISLLTVSMIGGIIILVTGNKNIQIPLAGLQALMLAGLFIISLLFPDFQVNKDQWVIMML